MASRKSIFSLLKIIPPHFAQVNARLQVGKKVCHGFNQKLNDYKKSRKVNNAKIDESPVIVDIHHRITASQHVTYCRVNQVKDPRPSQLLFVESR